MQVVEDSKSGEQSQLNYDPLDPVVKSEPYPYYVELRRNEPALITTLRLLTNAVASWEAGRAEASA